MEFSIEQKARAQDIAALFTATFAAAEGAEEGELIGSLARRLMADTPSRDLYTVTAWDDGALVGAIHFSRLVFENDDRVVFMLAPVAVATDRQGEGIGQKLITHGLTVLGKDGVDVAVTYGDPNFYRRVGFAPVAQADMPAPFALQFPGGWLCQTLTAGDVAPFEGPSRCVAAFNDPVYW